MEGTQVAAFTENECSGSKGGVEAAAAAQPLVLVHLLRPLHFANVQLGSNWIGLVVVFPVVPKVQSLSLQDQLLSLYRGTFPRFPREGGDSAASEGTDCTLLTGRASLARKSQMDRIGQDFANRALRNPPVTL